MLTVAYNGTPSPLVVDDQGYTIGGHDWGVIETTDPEAARVLATGEVTLADEALLESVEGNERADAALAALAERRARIEAARSQDKDSLIAALGDDADALPTGGDGKPAKADLVEAVVAAETAEGVPVENEVVEDKPSTPKKSTSRRSGQ